MTGVVFLFAAIAILDLLFRGDMAYQNPGMYCVGLIAIFFFFWLLQHLIDMIPFKTMKIALGLIFSVFLGVLYASNYNYYSVYGKFMGPHEFSFLFGEFQYWKDNARGLFTNAELRALFWFSIPFILGLCGPVNRLAARMNLRQGRGELPHQIKPGRAVLPRVGNSLGLRLGFVFLTLLIVLRILKLEESRFVLTPEFAVYYGIKEYFKNTENYRIEPADVSFPERAGDPTAIRNGHRSPNIVFLLFESINMKHTSMENYHRDTTPNIKSYIKDNYQFYGIANSTTTTFSSTSLFTGVDFFKMRISKTVDKPLLWWYTNFADYKNHVFTSQWLRFRNKGEYFIDRNFTDTLKEPMLSSVSLGRDDHITVSVMEDELPNLADKNGGFFYLNFAGTHYPYRVGKKFRKWRPYREKGFHPREAELTINQYDNALLYFDAAFKKAIAVLKNNGLLENSVVILASDHGEAMMEHDRWGHGPIFYQEGIEAPIYLRIGGEIQNQFSKEELKNLELNQNHIVSNVDIFATVLDIMNVETERDLSGQSLLRNYPENIAINSRDRREFAAVNSHTGMKMIVYNLSKKMECMNIKEDPGELDITAFRITNRVRMEDIIPLLMEISNCRQLKDVYELQQ